MVVTIKVHMQGSEPYINQIPLVGSYPEKMSHEHREADGQGSRTQASIAPLVSHGKGADNKLQGEEDLNGGGHAQADAWLQLTYRRGETE